MSPKTILPPSLAFVDSLPAPPNLDVSSIGGNLTDEQKLQHAKGFWHLLSADEFAKDIGKRLRIMEVDFEDKIQRCELRHEIEVAKDMSNFLGVLHGACMSYIADVCCAGCIVLLGTRIGVDARVLTRSMELSFFHPVFLGDTLEMTTTSNDLRLARCEIRSKMSGKTCAVVVQSLGKPSRSKM
ncbi:hypothetical protein C8R47DRAFT_222717 [Mycena vitilis]|nr:hypothetical protein C8R47DRAFT_222717 [Mycena vitilis]